MAKKLSSEAGRPCLALQVIFFVEIREYTVKLAPISTANAEWPTAVGPLKVFKTLLQKEADSFVLLCPK